ncbi:tetratricopeptide repeat protein [Pseudogracilibacillus sp. SO30301A]|uniref:tetratricopeptide repeat protein n=1 Tax=Pseudogracilibacillus sp. SO30301A TaxID=3098291 RepID=UPI00300E1727
MAGAQINPLLIQLLTGKEITDIPNSPTRSWLPGKYASLINRKKELIERKFGENSYMITCKSCGRKGKYDVGLMLINTDESKVEKPGNSIQTTGYFRCKHCNDAGNWEMPSKFLMASVLGLIELSIGSPKMEKKRTFGKSLLFDGSWHLYCSDGEMHLLQLLKEEPGNSFIWNRLGNLYDKGNRPELAAAVYEHSIEIDHGQIESHFSLGGYFVQIKEFDKSAYHFKQMLLGASEYDLLSAEKLREMLACCLTELFYIYQNSNGEIPFIPTKEELEVAGKINEMKGYQVGLELELFQGDPESFYPLAEMYMGAQCKKLPKRLRTLEVSKLANKKKKKRKRRKKKR